MCWGFGWVFSCVRGGGLAHCLCIFVLFSFLYCVYILFSVLLLFYFEVLCCAFFIVFWFPYYSVFAFLYLFSVVVCLEPDYHV